jgi:hypothetical protein
MTTINNYDQQYEFAKNATIKAISSGENVVLWGDGPTGKSHLIQELESHITDSDYHHMSEPSRGDTSDDFTNRVEYCKKDKWITAINDIDHIHSTLKHHSFVFVNMNEFKYPKYGTLRSGRSIV